MSDIFRISDKVDGSSSEQNSLFLDENQVKDYNQYDARNHQNQIKHIAIQGNNFFQENSYIDDVVNYGQTFIGDMSQKQNFKKNHIKNQTEIHILHDYKDDDTKPNVCSQQDVVNNQILNQQSIQDESDDDSSFEDVNKFLKNNLHDVSQITGTDSLQTSQYLIGKRNLDELTKNDDPDILSNGNPILSQSGVQILV